MRKNSKTSAGSQISLRERIVDNLELPKDLMLGAAIVTVTGRGEAVISNYKGILESGCRQKPAGYGLPVSVLP